jgi:hypothetical protein
VALELICFLEDLLVDGEDLIGCLDESVVLCESSMSSP